MIPINKIEPVAFAPKGYLNVGDTMPLRVMIAAYDSNDVSKIHYSEDPEMKEINEITGPLTIKATTPGIKNIYGKIAVKERGNLVWKPWTFSYEVGQPTASISATDLNVLYTGFDNHIAAVASGFSNAETKLVGAGVSITKEKDGYLVTVPPAMAGQKVKLSVVAQGKNVGSMEFRVRNVPKPSTFFGNFSASDSKITRSQLLANLNAGLRLGYDQNTIINVPFKVASYEIELIIPGSPKRVIKVKGPTIPLADQTLIKQLRPGSIIAFTSIQGGSRGGAVRGGNIMLTIQ